MPDDNIIQFPKENKRLPIKSYLQRREISLEHSNSAGSLSLEATNILILLLIEDLEHMKIDTKNSEYIYDFALLLESLKSYIFASNDIYHPLQDLARALFYKKKGIILLNEHVINRATETNT